jgi:hypothetical protein
MYSSPGVASKAILVSMREIIAYAAAALSLEIQAKM